MRTNAIPELAGKFSINLVNASTPPADAPIPTIGNGLGAEPFFLAFVWAVERVAFGNLRFIKILRQAVGPTVEEQIGSNTR